HAQQRRFSRARFANPKDNLVRYTSSKSLGPQGTVCVVKSQGIEEFAMANSALNQKLGSSGSVTRAQAVKGLWDYVKENNMQNPQNKREILADDKLQPLFGKKKITMFEVGKILNSHLSKPENAGKPKKSAA